MLLGDADIECALGKGFSKQVEPRAGRHGGGDRNYLVVVLRLADERVCKHARIGGRVGLRLCLRTGDDIEGADAVIFIGSSLSGA